MNGWSKGYDGDRTEFDRIVARLHNVDQPGGAPRPGAVVRSGRAPLPNGTFATISLAVIVPMSIVIGGWVGLLAVVVSTVVTGLLLTESHPDRTPDAPR
jgi:hypothetical protein